MSPTLSRRALLGYVGATGVTQLAGCGQPNGKPSRELSFRDIHIEKVAGTWRLTFELVKVARGPEELETFHDVTVHAYDENQREACTKEIGTIEKSYPGGNGLPVEMECSAPPTMLTYSAAESPCDENVVTIISIAIYDEEQGWSYDLHSRECGEGLPPEPRG